MPGYRAASLRAPYDYRKSIRSFLGQNDNLKSSVVLMITVQCPYDVTAMCLRANDFFSNLSLCGVNKIVEATMPVNPYDDRKVSLRRPYGNGDLDIVRASYGKCNRGINDK